MIPSLFGQGSPTNDLRGALDELSATHKTLAERIANASGRSAASGFAGELDQALLKQEASLSRDMAALADTELRYETASKLLQKSYADLRTAIGGGNG